MARNENMIAALKRERAGYVARGDTKLVAQVDEQLRHYGYDGVQDPVTDPDGGPKGRTASNGQRTTSRTADTRKVAPPPKK